MSTSVTKVRYLNISLGTLIFSLIYELFSHHVYSKYMLFAFLIPLILGYFKDIIMCNFKLKKSTSMNESVHLSGIMTLTIGSILMGVLEIFGTTNKLICVYLYTGLFLLTISLLLYILNYSKKN